MYPTMNPRSSLNGYNGSEYQLDATQLGTAVYAHRWDALKEYFQHTKKTYVMIMVSRLSISLLRTSLLYGRARKVVVDDAVLPIQALVDPGAQSQVCTMDIQSHPSPIRPLTAGQLRRCSCYIVGDSSDPYWVEHSPHYYCIVIRQLAAPSSRLELHCISCYTDGAGCLSPQLAPSKSSLPK